MLVNYVPHLIVNTKFTPCSNFPQTDCEKRKKFGNGNTFAQQTPLLRLWILFPPSSEAYFGKYWRWKEDMPFSFFSPLLLLFISTVTERRRLLRQIRPNQKCRLSLKNSSLLDILTLIQIIMIVPFQRVFTRKFTGCISLLYIFLVMIKIYFLLVIFNIHY